MLERRVKRQHRHLHQLALLAVDVYAQVGHVGDGSAVGAVRQRRTRKGGAKLLHLVGEADRISILHRLHKDCQPTLVALPLHWRRADCEDLCLRNVDDGLLDFLCDFEHRLVALCPVLENEIHLGVVFAVSADDALAKKRRRLLYAADVAHPSVYAAHHVGRDRHGSSLRHLAVHDDFADVLRRDELARKPLPDSPRRDGAGRKRNIQNRRCEKRLPRL